MSLSTAEPSATAEDHPPRTEARTDLLVVLGHVFHVRNYVAGDLLRRLQARDVRTALIVPEHLVTPVRAMVPEGMAVHSLAAAPLSAGRQRLLGWLRMGSMVGRRGRVEYQRKIAWSFSALFFIMLGLPVAVITHRREKSANVILAVLCAALYYLISLGCEGIGIQNLAPPKIIMWIPNVIAALAALILNYKCVS